jgi:hypothetical protein
MHCDTARDRLLTTDDPARPDADLAEHLAACPSCRDLAADLVGLEEAVRGYPTPPSVLARRDAFLANLSPTLPRRVRVRHIAAAFAALAAAVVVCVATVALLRPQPSPDGPAPLVAQADSAVVEDLVEWNLKLTEAEEPADRERLVRDRLPDLQARIAGLPADDRELAEQLLAHGRKLGGPADPVDAAEGFHELADTLLIKLDTAAEDPAQSVVYAKLFSQVVDRGVDRNLARAERQALKAEKQARVQNLEKAKKRQAARAAALAERIPEPARAHMKAAKAKPKEPRRPPK